MKSKTSKSSKTPTPIYEDEPNMFEQAAEGFELKMSNNLTEGLQSWFKSSAVVTPEKAG